MDMQVLNNGNGGEQHKVDQEKLSGKGMVVERVMAAYHDVHGIQLTRKRAEEIIFSTSYHEAGHAALYSFTGIGCGARFDCLSVIPDISSSGRMQAGSDPLNLDFNGDPWNVAWDKAHAKCDVLLSLSGPIAEAIANDEYYSLLSESEYPAEWDFLRYKTFADWQAGSDMGRAWTVAEALQSNTWPAFRVMAQMEKWTEEILRTPEVWDVVETLAGMLINNGVILRDDYFSIGSKIYGRKFSDRIWKRRLHPKRGKGLA